MTPAGFEDAMRAARAMAADAAIPAGERARMLMEIAADLQRTSESSGRSEAVVALYREARDLCPAAEDVLKARILARLGAALQSLPGGDIALLEDARACFAGAIAVLSRAGTPEECAEAEMGHGLALQNLADENRAQIGDAICAYRRALSIFTREAYPAEFAMLQNKIGNALQYASPVDAAENTLRALEAYDAALTVRGPDNPPLEYAGTLANKANCLWNLPDGPEKPEGANLKAARDHYAEARDIFAAQGEDEQARIVSEAIAALEREMPADDDLG